MWLRITAMQVLAVNVVVAVTIGHVGHVVTSHLKWIRQKYNGSAPCVQ